MNTLNNKQKSELKELLNNIEKLNDQKPDYTDFNAFISFGEKESDALRNFCELHNLPKNTDTLAKLAK